MCISLLSIEIIIIKYFQKDTCLWLVALFSDGIKMMENFMLEAKQKQKQKKQQPAAVFWRKFCWLLDRLHE